MEQLLSSYVDENGRRVLIRKHRDEYAQHVKKLVLEHEEFAKTKFDSLKHSKFCEENVKNMIDNYESKIAELECSLDLYQTAYEELDQHHDDKGSSYRKTISEYANLFQ